MWIQCKGEGRRAQGSGRRVQGAGRRAQGSELRAQGMLSEAACPPAKEGGTNCTLLRGSPDHFVGGA